MGRGSSCPCRHHAGWPASSLNRTEPNRARPLPSLPIYLLAIEYLYPTRGSFRPVTGVFILPTANRDIISLLFRRVVPSSVHHHQPLPHHRRTMATLPPRSRRPPTNCWVRPARARARGRGSWLGGVASSLARARPAGQLSDARIHHSELGIKRSAPPPPHSERCQHPVP